MNGPRIVSIGGGTGLSTLLRGLKKFPAQLSVIVTVSDDGGSSGRLREELNTLAPGDIRNCMAALSEDETLMSKLFQYRFDTAGDLHGHSFGNLFLTAMAGVTGDFAEAVRLTSEVLAIKGRIFPSTNANVSLLADMVDGSLLAGETRISGSKRQIRRVHLDPEDAEALPEALQTIAEADLITLGPGSLYTSLIPNLLARRMISAIRASSAAKVYVQNIMTQPGETAGYSVARHVQALREHCGNELLFKTVLVNTRVPSNEAMLRYRQEGAELVRIDHAELESQGIGIVERDLLADDAVIRHDPEKLARGVLELVRRT